ncbi:hypothetical protein [Faucicola boevrei]|uniref:hypothetical protein n=1 Tax=Faucicola boevrei TaxID=346665 RepID=UPI00037AF00F|nr:hypothetical protein [Moraxella boevrei]
MQEKFAEFLELLADYDDPSELLELFDSLVGDRVSFSRFLMEAYGLTKEEAEEWQDDDEAYEDEEDREYSRRLQLSAGVCLLLREFGYVYNDDWKMDYEGLSEHISEWLDQEFEITFEECKMAFDDSDGEAMPADVIRQKIEQESDFTLLEFISGDDDVNFAIVQKTDKAKILELADELGIIVE